MRSERSVAEAVMVADAVRDIMAARDRARQAGQPVPPLGQPAARRVPTQTEASNSRADVIQLREEREQYTRRLEEAFLEMRLTPSMARQAAAGRGGLQLVEADVSKTEAPTASFAGGEFGPTDYAYTPDRAAPASWQLRLSMTPGGLPDARLVAGAVAGITDPSHFAPGLVIPEADQPAVLSRLRAAWLKANPKADPATMPAILGTVPAPHANVDTYGLAASFRDMGLGDSTAAEAARGRADADEPTLPRRSRVTADRLPKPHRSTASSRDPEVVLKEAFMAMGYNESEAADMAKGRQ